MNFELSNSRTNPPVLLNLLIGVVPIALLCLFVYRRDAARPERPLHLLLTFLVGALLALPAFFIEEHLERLGAATATTFVPYTLYMFLGVALVEEGLKYAAVIAYPFRRAFFDEPLDGIVYCVFAAMGFATFETVYYATMLPWEAMAVRAGLAVPAHAAFAMIAGYFLGRARVEPDGGNRTRLVALGLLWSVVAHGLYDWFIFNPYAEWLMLLAVVVLVVCWGVALRLTANSSQQGTYRGTVSTSSARPSR